MSYDSRERSRTQGEPQTLYRFTYQGEAFRYTDAERPITFEGEVYTPLPIDRGAVTSSGTLDKAQLRIEVPHNCAVSNLFRVFPPSDVVGLTIFQGHDEEPTVEFLAAWVGRVLSGGRKGTLATLTCEPIVTSMRRPGLRRRYQYGCPHVLYGAQCGVDREDFSVDAAITAVNGGTLTFGSGWAGSFVEADFVNGLCQVEMDGVTVLRTILRVDTVLNKITVSGAIPGLVSGLTVTLSLGCNHQMSGCTSFGNIKNFGGQPWIPKKNPLGFVNQFY